MYSFRLEMIRVHCDAYHRDDRRLLQLLSSTVKQQPDQGYQWGKASIPSVPTDR